MSANPIQRVIDRYQKNLAAAQQLQELIAENPSLMDELKREFAGKVKAKTTKAPTVHKQLPNPKPIGGPPAAAPAPQAPLRVVTGKTHFETIRDYLREVGNAWRSTSELAVATRLSRESVSRVVYKSHKSYFEYMPRAGVGETRIKDWRLKANTSAMQL